MPSQFNIPVPIQQGSVGASVDISAAAPILTVLSFQADPNSAFTLEQSFQPSAPTFFTPVPGGGFGGGAQTLVVEAEGNFIRCRRVAGTGAAGQNLQAADQSQAGTPTHVGPLTVPATGPGTVGNISGEPANLVVTFNGSSPTDQTTVEHSFDGVSYAPLGVVFSGQGVAFVSGANDIRANTRSGISAAGTLDVYGAPK
jgi:hypothetical protein